MQNSLSNRECSDNKTPAPPSYLRRHWKPLLAGFLAVTATLMVGALWGSFNMWLVRESFSHLPSPQQSPGAVDADGRLQPPDTPETLLCREFRDRKNADDPTSADLLGPAPVVPAEPVSQEEADRFATEFFLRQDLRVVGVGWDAARQKPVLYTRGNVSAPTLNVQTGAGVETAQRTMANPDLVVEVRDGRIYGVAARLHL